MIRLLPLIMILSCSVMGQSQWSMGYWSLGYGWPGPTLPVSDIQWRGLTHAIHIAAHANADGTLDLTTYYVSSTAAAFVAAAHTNNVKALLNIGQNGSPGTALQAAVTSYLSTLVTNIMTVVNTYGYDGVDIDWEPWSSGTNGAAMTSLASALRTALGSKVLTVAIDSESAYWASNSSYFDRLNEMTYGGSGTWNAPGGLWHNDALFCGGADSGYKCVDGVKVGALSAGIPANKLGVGFAFYGTQYTGGVLNSDHSQGISGPRQVWETGQDPVNVGSPNYNAVVPLITGSSYFWDGTASVSYLGYVGATPPDYWYLTYDNPQSIAAKVQYSISRGLGGWIIWTLDADYFPSATPMHPLMDAVALSVASGSGAGAHSTGMAMSAGGIH